MFSQSKVTGTDGGVSLFYAAGFKLKLEKVEKVVPETSQTDGNAIGQTLSQYTSAWDAAIALMGDNSSDLVNTSTAAVPFRQMLEGLLLLCTETGRWKLMLYMSEPSTSDTMKWIEWFDGLSETKHLISTGVSQSFAKTAF
jgi:hypothetical protein